MATEVQTVTLAGKHFVIVPENEYRQLLGENREPPLPDADAKGNYPAVESARVVLATKSSVGSTRSGWLRTNWRGGRGFAWKRYAGWNTASTAPMSPPCRRLSVYSSERKPRAKFSRQNNLTNFFVVQASRLRENAGGTPAPQAKSVNLL